MIFQCENCGGNVVYDPEKGKMHCPYCDSSDSEAGKTGSGLVCAGCGGQLPAGDFASACKCSYCGSYNIIEERVQGEYTPHLVLPFQFGKKTAKERIIEQFKKKRFLPSTFLSDAYLERMEGTYVPFFLYDYFCRYRFEGTGKKVRVWTVGDTEYTETSLYKVERNMNVDFSKIPVDASIKMEDGMMDLLEPYDYQALEAFQEKYLSGFLAERFNMDSDELSVRAREKAKSDAKQLARNTMKGYQSIHTNYEQADLDLKDTQYSLFPVWSYQYDYGGKKYCFHLNGQTGKLVGQAPVSYKKAAAYSTTVFMGVLAVFYLIGMILEVL